LHEIENDDCQFQAMDSYPGGFVLFRNLVKSPVNFSKKSYSLKYICVGYSYRAVMIIKNCNICVQKIIILNPFVVFLFKV
jgi:hypothetical protein